MRHNIYFPEGIYEEIKEEAYKNRKSISKHLIEGRNSGIRNQGLMARYLNEHEFCENCLGKKSEHVHHIIHFAKGGPDEYDNYLALCKDCHKERHPPEKRNNGYKRICLYVEEADWKQVQHSALDVGKSVGQFLMELYRFSRAMKDSRKEAQPEEFESRKPKMEPLEIIGYSKGQQISGKYDR